MVATAGHLEHSSDAPPHTYVVGWGAERTWQRRTDAWLDAMTRVRPVAVTGVPIATESELC